MPQNEFRVRKSSTGYCVELCRDGQAYVTFVDGLTKRAAEQEAHALTVLWKKISATSWNRSGDDRGRG